MTDRIPALCFGAIAIGYLFACRGIPAAAAAMPVQVGWVTLLLCAADLVALQVWPPAKPLLERADTRRQALAVGGVLLLGGGMLAFGLLPAVAIFMFAAIRFAGRSGPLASLAIAGLVTLALYLIFARLLQLDLFWGLLFGGEL